MSLCRELLDGFERDMADAAKKHRLKREQMLGVRSRVNGIPSLFINGVRCQGATGPVDDEELREAIGAALAERSR